MIERKLSKPQIRIFSGLSAQRAQLQHAFQEVLQAEQEQIEMLRVKYELPGGEYKLRQERNGEVVMFMVEPEKEKGEIASQARNDKKEEK